MSWNEVIIWVKPAAPGFMTRAGDAELLGVMQSLILGANPVNHAVNQVWEHDVD